MPMRGAWWVESERVSASRERALATDKAPASGSIIHSGMLPQGQTQEHKPSSARTGRGQQPSVSAAARNRERLPSVFFSLLLPTGDLLRRRDAWCGRLLTRCGGIESIPCDVCRPRGSLAN